MSDPHGARNIPIGTPVRGFDGTLLGYVREAYPHYLAVGEEGEPEDFQVPVHAILGFEGGELRVSVTPGSVTEVDDLETALELEQE
jgi:hypothetical protein